jgi:hypothetical protein
VTGKVESMRYCSMNALINDFSTTNTDLEVHSTSKMNVLSLTSQYSLRVGEAYPVTLQGHFGSETGCDKS